MGDFEPSKVLYSGDHAAFHKLLVQRIYHEDMLFAQRAYVLLTVHAFLLAAFTLLITSEKQLRAIWLIAIVLSFFGSFLGIFQAAFGRQTRQAIGFWRTYVKLLEVKQQIPFDHLQYEFYGKGEVATPFGLIKKRKVEQKAIYEVFSGKKRFLTSMVTVLGSVFPAALALLWILVLGYSVYRLAWSFTPCVRVVAAILVAAIPTLAGLYLLSPSLAEPDARD